MLKGKGWFRIWVVGSLAWVLVHIQDFGIAITWFSRSPTCCEFWEHPVEMGMRALIEVFSVPVLSGAAIIAVFWIIRGFQDSGSWFRIWIVGSVAWVLYALWWAFTTTSGTALPYCPGCRIADPVGAIDYALTGLFGVPVLFGATIIAGSWIIRGFRSA